MKLGRNDLCSCGSGKKYKKCCLSKEESNVVNIDNIVKYQNIRKFHSGLTDKMLKYFNKEFKYELSEKFYDDMSYLYGKNINNYKLRKKDFIEEVYYGMFMFNNGVFKSIPEIFLELNFYDSNRERKFYNALIESYVGVFEIVDINTSNALVEIKDIVNGKVFKIIDINLSSGFNQVDKIYIMGRIVNFDNIYFNCMGIPFLKDNKRIHDFVNKIKKRDVCDLAKVIYLYNEIYKLDSKKINIL